MKTILLLGGTSDARRIAQALENLPLHSIISVATPLGAAYMHPHKQIQVITGRLDYTGLCALLQETKPFLVLDASHPYATEISLNSIQACRAMDIPYLRFERASCTFLENTLFFDSYETIVSFLNQNDGNFLLTTGINFLSSFTQVKNWPNRAYARVLNTPASIQKVQALGFLETHILLGDGAFLYQDIVCALQDFHTSFLVTKDSGIEGGVNEKIQAAKNRGVTLLVLKRPHLQYPHCTSSLDELMIAVIKEAKL